MRIISRKKLKEFWEIHPNAKKPLEAWFADAKNADWNNPNEVKKSYANASIITNNRVVFNIKGNSYRLIVAVNYFYKIIYIRFIGTHEEYDKINAEEI